MVRLKTAVLISLARLHSEGSTILNIAIQASESEKQFDRQLGLLDVDANPSAGSRVVA